MIKIVNVLLLSSTLLLSFPALVLLPDPFDNRVIRFRPNDNDTYAYYVTHLNDYIDGG